MNLRLWGAILLLCLVPGVAWAAEPTAAKSYGIWALAPALIAIVLALVTRQVLLSLLGGILIGAGIMHGALDAFARTLDLLVVVTANADHAKVVIFTLFMGSMVALVSASGGTKGIVAEISKYAKTRKSAGIASWLLGMAIFFDDYASTLLVGSTMRPLTDRMRISREKLSYIVDSTAAPIASLALATTWIGYEVSTMGKAMEAAGIMPSDVDPMRDVFIAGIPSRFYQIFALLFVAIVAWMGRDFGPMLKAERRAASTGEVLAPGARPLLDASVVEDQEKLEALHPRWWLAALPIGGLIVAVLVALYAIKIPDPYDAMLYASAIGVLIAFFASLGAGALSLEEAVDAVVQGIRAMALAVMVLILAWGISETMDQLQAGPYVAGLIGEALPAWALASVTFLLAAVIAFATGTSFGTMGILFPIVIPVIALHQGDAGFMGILISTTSAVLGGAVFGDHCSPISDTTVLSSIASSADHVDHTRTQAPYALLCAGVALGLGYLPMGFGVPAWLLAPLGIGALVVTLRVVGRPVVEET
jgi:Na+/H+ antiporter NhaC